MQTKYIPYSSAHRPTLWRKAVALAGMAAVAVLALMFSAVLLTALLMAAVIGGISLWWKTREFRKQRREQQVASFSQTASDLFGVGAFEGDVIEGEVMRVHESDAAR